MDRSLTTRTVIVRIMGIVALCELAIMLVLGVVPFRLGVIEEAFLDMATLALLSTPLIYQWVVRPFIRARNEALERLGHLADTDALTQLANRRRLSRHLEMAIASSERHAFHGALLLMDLDEFKPINDTYGHDAGDAVLVEVARRLRSITRTDDVAARVGGDEFVLLVSHLDPDRSRAAQMAEHIAAKLVESVGQPIEFQGIRLSVNSSIGIRLLGDGPMGTETAMREADVALYRAKQSPRKRIVLFTPTAAPE